LNPVPNTLSIRLSDNMAFDATTHTVHAGTDALAAGVELVATYVDEGGRSSRHRLDFQIEANLISVFDLNEKLADLALIPGSSPATIVHVENGSHAQLSAGSGRVHTSWKGTSGDGLYRMLLRVSPDAEAILDRRVGFAGRIRREGTDWSGIRLELYEAGGIRKVHLREYYGSGGNTRPLDTSGANWTYDAWHWLELEAKGKSIRGRIYAEAATTPSWQVSAETSQLQAGAFGPHLFPANTAKKIDIKRIEFEPPA
jgi:hypothetical protein